MTSSSEWNDVEVKFVRVDAGKNVLTREALNLISASPPTASSALSNIMHGPTVIDVQPADQAVYCIQGDTIRLNGHASGQNRLDRRSLEVDGQAFDAETVNSNTNDYAYDWKAAKLGTHTLAVKYELRQPHDMLTIRQITVSVVQKPLMVVVGLPDAIPSDTVADFQIVDAHTFQPARVEAFINGSSVGVATHAPFQLVLPISHLAPGIYNITYQAYDAKGAHFTGDAKTIEVPERATVKVPSTVRVTELKETTSLAADLAAGLKSSRVDYFVGDTLIASSTRKPYEAFADFSTLKSGTYSVKAQVTTDDGATFTSPTNSITLTNRPDDDRLARLANEDAKRQAALQKEEQEKQARLAKQISDDAAAKAEAERITKEEQANLAFFWPRRGFDEKVFRNQAAALAFYVPEQRRGDVGKVHGLSILVADGVPQFGTPLTVMASVRPGTGKTNFLAFAEDNSRVTAEQAAEYCKLKTTAFRWDWSKYDLTVGYLENDLKNGGNSAGAADALAMMSAVLNTPVDSSVAITGAITLQGQIEPVGGIGLKVESAFADTNVHSVIVPADAISTNDLIQLYVSRPALCLNRRVIFARNMDDVMNQALLGWNTKVRCAKKNSCKRRLWRSHKVRIRTP